MEILSKYIQESIKLMNEMSPYLLLGFLIAGILHIVFPKQKVIRYMGKNNFRSVFNAALLGVPLPLCSCGVIPTGMSFYKSGASKGATVSFLISTPQTGVDSILVTYSLLGLPFAILRPFIALVTGLLGGILTNRNSPKNETVVQEISEIRNEKPTGNVFVRIFKYAFVEFLQDIANWLVIGLLLAVAISLLIPENFFTYYIGNEYLSMLIVLLAAVPLYVCATGSVPIAAVLMMKGLSPGAALVFLMAGPATNAATITVLAKVLGKKSLFAYLFAIIGGALFFGILLNNFLPKELFQSMNHSAHQHQHNEILPLWFQYVCSVLLILFIANSYIQKFISGRKSPNKKRADDTKHPESLEVIVKGMNCNRCKETVETNLLKINNIKTVHADITNCTVSISGDVIDEELIKTTVEGLGYTFEGKRTQ